MNDERNAPVPAGQGQLAVDEAPEQYAIDTSAATGTEPTRVLKGGETFAVFDRSGDVSPVGLGEHGLYHLGMRHLSRSELRVSGHPLLLLGSNVREENDLLAIDLTNPDIRLDDGGVVPREILHLFRSIFLVDGVCYERLRIVNYRGEPTAVSLTIGFAADFADIFEVRGMRRPRRGELRPTERASDGLLFTYVGLDGVERRTRIRCAPAPSAASGDVVRFDLRLPPQQAVDLLITTICEAGGTAPEVLPYDAALDALSRRFGEARERQARIDSAHEQFTAWVRRSVADLHMMTTDTACGPYPYAGVPWFSTPFGRDGLITALQLLWADPEIARGVLCYLARTQSLDHDPARDAEPGKILHESRHGEMAALGEIPFAQYYGTVDATPLFVYLAGEYWRRTADRALIEELWPAIERAVSWLDTHGDPDGDGFVEYHRRSEDGLLQQGWKDSHDSVFHEDGSMAVPPIALCEVQAYTYGARLAAADIAEALGKPARAAALRGQADTLRTRFDDAFWLDDLSTYAIALDGRKRPCRVVTSNAGHSLLTGLAGRERAERLAGRLLQDDAFSGWGVRTVAWDQARYNPMAYHNGSVWPHDTAVVAAGFGRYGLTDAAIRLTEGLFEVSRFVDLQRLPELLCGFRRRPGQGPTLYPVACAPQSWAAGAVFMLLQACLGLTIDATRGRISFVRGQLPEFLPWLKISNLRVGAATVDLLLDRHAADVGINVLRREGDVEIFAVK
jgi:glycogen debranching enzyme